MNDERRHVEIEAAKTSLWTNGLVGLIFVMYGCAMLTFPSDFRMGFGVFLLTVLKAALPIVTIMTNFSIVQRTVNIYLEFIVHNIQRLRDFIYGAAIGKS